MAHVSTVGHHNRSQYAVGAAAVATLLLVAVVLLNVRPGANSFLNRLTTAQLSSHGTLGSTACDCSECRAAVAAAADTGGAAAAAANANAALEQQPAAKCEPAACVCDCPKAEPKPCPEAPECPKCPEAAEPPKCPDPPACPDAAAQESTGAQQSGPTESSEIGQTKRPVVINMGAAAGNYDAAFMKRLWEYEPYLSPRSLRQGLYSVGEGSRMRRFTHKLLSGQPISLSAVGGSVTAGQGAVYGHPYISRVWEWVQQVSPDANHTLRHAAFGGSTSGIFTVCVKDMVQPDVDLVFVEFGINDLPSTGNFREPSRLGFERLLRKLLDFEGRPAVVLLHHYSWFSSGGGGKKRADYLKSAENDFNVFGQYYSLPLLSMRAAAYQLMLNKVKGYQAHTWFRDHPKEVEDDLFYYDEVHPQDRTGHRALMDLFVALVRQTALDLSHRPLDNEDEQVAKEALPEPVIPGNYQRRSSTCLLQRNFEKVVVKQEGFVWKNERPGAELANEKWGWISEQPGSWAELEVDTTSDLKGDLVSETNEIVISYLKSYQHMGKANVTCVANCKCDETTLDGYWAQENSLTELHRFQASQHEQCRVRVTVLDASSSPDGGRKVKLVGVMVVEGGFSVDALGVQLDLFANRGDTSEPMGR